MDSAFQPLVELAASLTALAAKGTVTAINTRIKSSVNEKNIETLRSFYEEIINELLSEREEAIRIAQIYKSEIEKIEISDKDITHLHNTVSKVISILSEIALMTGRVQGPAAEKELQQQLSVVGQIKDLVSIDALKTMQLLGFNFKAAIGEPLTKLCADAILGFGDKKKNPVRKK